MQLNHLSTELLNQEAFLGTLDSECNRIVRSQRGFLLMLVEPRKLLSGPNSTNVFDRLMSALDEATRDTDVKGWYVSGSVLGVIYRELGTATTRSAAGTIAGK